MTLQFAIRQMLPDDGPALKQLMENDPETSEMSLVTRFLVDPYQAWAALKPTMVGVVAEAPGAEGLAGVATVAFDEVQFDGRVLPAAHLENLKVHHAYRGRGIGTKLAEWRVAEARARFGDDGVILTSTSSENTASLATMKKWCSQFVGPIMVMPRSTRNTPPAAPTGMTVRPAEERDLAEIADKSNRFYGDYNLYTPLSAEKLAAALSISPTIYHYRVAVNDGGEIAAGIMASDRSQLMVDEFRNVPPPMRANPRFPSDGLLRLLEARSVWCDELESGQYLWEHLRWEFRDRVNNLSMQIDPRSPLKDLIPEEAGALKLEITLAIKGPSIMDGEKLICGGFRG